MNFGDGTCKILSFDDLARVVPSRVPRTEPWLWCHCLDAHSVEHGDAGAALAALRDEWCSAQLEGHQSSNSTNNSSGVGGGTPKRRPVPRRELRQAWWRRFYAACRAARDSSGKWFVRLARRNDEPQHEFIARVDRIWTLVAGACLRGELGPVCKTVPLKDGHDRSTVIIVYVADMFDGDDVRRVLRAFNAALRPVKMVVRIRFKADAATLLFAGNFSEEVKAYRLNVPRHAELDDDADFCTELLYYQTMVQERDRALKAINDEERESAKQMMRKLNEQSGSARATTATLPARSQSDIVPVAASNVDDDDDATEEMLDVEPSRSHSDLSAQMASRVVYPAAKRADNDSESVEIVESGSSPKAKRARTQFFCREKNATACQLCVAAIYERDCIPFP